MKWCSIAVSAGNMPIERVQWNLAPRPAEPVSLCAPSWSSGTGTSSAGSCEIQLGAQVILVPPAWGARFHCTARSHVPLNGEEHHFISSMDALQGQLGAGGSIELKFGDSEVITLFNQSLE